MKAEGSARIPDAPEAGDAVPGRRYRRERGGNGFTRLV